MLIHLLIVVPLFLFRESRRQLSGKTRNNSRSIGISNSSAGFTPRWYQGRWDSSIRRSGFTSRTLWISDLCSMGRKSSVRSACCRL